MAATDAFLPLGEWLGADEWPLPGLIADSLSGVFFAPPRLDPKSGEQVLALAFQKELVVRVPGVEAFALALGGPGVTNAEIRVATDPLKITVRVPVVLRVDADVLRPLKPGTDEPDTDAEYLEISLGGAGLGVDAEGHVTPELAASASVPPCVLGSTGTKLSVGALRWLTPATPSAQQPPNTPADFTGLYLDDVTLDVPQLPSAVSALRLDDVFLGTGGFSGKLSQPNLSLAWDGSRFTGPVAGELFGFKGGLSAISLEFRQSALVGCSIRGDVYVPWLEKRVGLSIGLDGVGGVAAAAGLPTSTPAESGITAGGGGYLLRLEIGGFLTFDLDGLKFTVAPGPAAAVELSGRVALDVGGLEDTPFEFRGLRVDTSGKVAIERGWIPLRQAKSSGLGGFPLEITRIGFGSDDSGRRWLGLNGGLKLAEGLPLGASVEGLRVSWLPMPSPPQTLATLRVRLDGVGLEVKVPGTFEFTGKVNFFDDETGTGFQGHVRLALTTLGLTVDATLLVGRTPAGDTFFFIFLAVDLPTGIPLFSTGAAFYGFAGLLSTGMVPDRRSDESWYYGWYRRPPQGTGTDDPRAKWRVQPGAFALGVGATIGTSTDDGFAFSAKPLLILVLPGPILLLQGKASFLAKRPGSQQRNQEGTLDSLIVLDVPGKLFQANLAATYKVDNLLDAAGGADVGFSWAPPSSRPKDLWHLYLGEKTPEERRIRAQLLKVLKASTWFQLWSTGIQLGAWVGVAERYQWGPVAAWFEASIEGEAALSVDPADFTGTLRLRGNAGIAVFGARIEAVLDASVTAKGPRPWYLTFRIYVAITIDLWLFKFHFEAEITPSWGDPLKPLPAPALPAIERIAWEHEKVQEPPAPDQPVALDGTVVPPDARPVVVFRRPVRDVAGIGAPGSPNLPPADAVGPRAFSYRLGHLVLSREAAGGAHQVVAAAGVVQVTGGSITLLGGVALSGASGSRLLLLDGKKDLEVTGSSAGALTVSGSVGLPDGEYAYRLRGPARQAAAQVVTAQGGPSGTGTVALAADPAGGPADFTGGSLATATGEWLVLGTSGALVTVRTPAQRAPAGTTPPALPAAGSATLSAPPGPTLQGCWLPAADTDPAPTKLQVWARTPYAWFRRSEQQTLDDWEALNPDYACGPAPAEEPICVGFETLDDGPVPPNFQIERISGTASGAVRAENRMLSVGLRESGLPGTGTVTLRFDPPVDWVALDCATREGGQVVLLRGGLELAARSVPKDLSRLAFDDLADAADEVRVHGTFVDLYGICFRPGWSCVAFDPVTFPQRSSGRQSYAGLTWASNCTMEVVAGALRASEPCVGGGIPISVGGPIPIGVFLYALTVELPLPVTRARVRLATGPAAIIGWAAADPDPWVAQSGGEEGDDVLVVALDRWIDRVTVLGTAPVAISRFCHDGGPFPWQRFEQWFRSQGVRRAVVAFYQEDPVLPPGGYRLDVLTAWDDEHDPVGPAWTTTAARFTVGTPPQAEVTASAPAGTSGGRYPGGGPLSELATYVAATLPPAGAAHHYRAYDVAVRFNSNYVTRMYLAAGQALTVAVADANDADRRAGALNVWGRGSALDVAGLTREDAAWIRTLNGDGTQRCAEVDVSKIVHNETVTAGAGEVLARAQLHTGELRAGARRLFRFDFTTSRFAGFTHHLGTFDGRCRIRIGAGVGLDPAGMVAVEQPVAAASAALDLARGALAQATVPISNGTPTRAELDAYDGARGAVTAAETALEAARAHAFASAWSAYFGDRPPAQLPASVELTRVLPAAGSSAPAALLLESPEPMAPERVVVEAVGRSALVPPRRRLIRFEEADGFRGFGAPDQGTFRYAGLTWTTDVELRLVDGAVVPRVPGPWILRIALAPSTTVSLEVRIDDGGAAKLTATGSGASVTDTQGPTSGTIAAMRVTGSDLTRLQLEGTGIALFSVSVDEIFQPVAPQGPLRLLRGRLPANEFDRDHFVDLVAYADVPAAGWSIRWLGIADPGQAGHYLSLPTGVTLRDGRVARLYGGRADPPGEPQLDVYGAGGTPGTLPFAADGALLQLLDPSGMVIHELAALRGSLYTSPILGAAQLHAYPSGDGTRLMILPATGTLGTGHMRVSLRFNGDIGPARPVLSIGGVPQIERAALTFTTE